MKKHMTPKNLALLACLTIALAGSGCTDKETSHFEGVHSFIVTAIPDSGQYGTVDSPLATTNMFVGKDAFGVTLAAYAVDIEGNLVSDFNGTVELSSEPGELDKTQMTFTNGMVGNWVLGANGKYTYNGGGERVTLRYAFGTTRIWVEDTQRTERTDILGPDGTVLGKTTCLNNKATEDGLYCEPSLATGVSEEFVFQPQTIRMIQYNPEHPAAQSPLNKQYGQIKAMKGHDLVVTNVVSTGFYVTDLGDDDYNSIFIFTFSQPGRVEIGDRICEVSGGIAEFTGMTQLQFPSWGIQNKEQSTAQDIDPAPEDGDQGVGSCIDPLTGQTRPCTQEELEAMDAIVDCSDVYYDHELTKEEKKAFAKIDSPEPKAITKSNYIKLNNINDQEALETSVVTVQDIRLTTEFIDCDDNGNLKIETGTAEAECRNTCTRSNTSCTELSSLTSYDQWRAWTIESNGELSVASSSLISGFDITQDRWKYNGYQPNWENNGCYRNSDNATMTCDSCYEWKDPTSGRRMIRCAERRLKRLTGNLKQVLPGCSGTTFCDAANFKTESMVMKVIEQRFTSDLVFDEAYNIQAEIAFQECRADTQTNGCLDACKISSAWCSCDAFAQYRKDYPVPGAPTACASRVTP